MLERNTTYTGVGGWVGGLIKRINEHIENVEIQTGAYNLLRLIILPLHKEKIKQSNMKGNTVSRRKPTALEVECRQSQ
jgi:hypothetical protein